MTDLMAQKAYRKTGQKRKTVPLLRGIICGKVSKQPELRLKIQGRIRKDIQRLVTREKNPRKNCLIQREDLHRQRNIDPKCADLHGQLNKEPEHAERHRRRNREPEHADRHGLRSREPEHAGYRRIPAQSEDSG